MKFEVLIVILLIVAIIGCSAAFNFNDHAYTVTVTDKERVNKDDDSYYLVFCETEDGKTVVLKDDDTLLRGKFNSSDIYAEIEVGEQYIFTVVGYRIPFFSTYENIIEMEAH